MLTYTSFLAISYNTPLTSSCFNSLLYIYLIIGVILFFGQLQSTEKQCLLEMRFEAVESDVFKPGPIYCQLLSSVHYFTCQCYRLSVGVRSSQCQTPSGERCAGQPMCRKLVQLMTIITALRMLPMVFCPAFSPMLPESPLSP